jgi:uncharacterized protein YggT (Ycf19 family)
MATQTTQIYRDRVSRPPGSDERVYQERVTQSYIPGYYNRTTGVSFIYFLFNLLEGLLLIRFLLKFLAANPGAPFVRFIYNVTAVFVAPFRGIFPPLAEQGSVLESSTLVAIIVYALLVYAIVRLIRLASKAYR